LLFEDYAKQGVEAGPTAPHWRSSVHLMNEMEVSIARCQRVRGLGETFVCQR